MAALINNPQLLLAAFVRMTRGLYTTAAEQIAWLAALQQQALIGSATGVADVLANLQDYSATGVANEGASTQWLREYSAGTIAQLCEAALQLIEADGDTPGSGASDNTQHSSFGAFPTRLG